VRRGGPRIDALVVGGAVAVGDKDLLNPNAMRDNMHDWALANENTAKALAAKGYHHQLVFVRNAGGCDGKMKQQILPEAMEYV
jgi:enterochelin esterase family protein